MKHAILTLALAGGIAALAGGSSLAQSSPAPAGAAAPAAMSPDAAPDAATVSLGRQRIVEMLKTGQADEAWFSGAFLSQISVSDVDAVIQQVEGLAGTFKYVQGTKSPFTGVFTKGSDEILIRFDADHKIDYLLFKPVH